LSSFTHLTHAWSEEGEQRSKASKLVFESEEPLLLLLQDCQMINIL